MNRDGELSRFVLSFGYLFLAIIILINYLGQKPDVRAGKVVINQGPVTEEMQQLRQQLDEERRLNLEMRNMLKDVQSAMGAYPEVKATGLNALPPQISFEKIIRDGIPTLSVTIPDRTVIVASPFTPGKNPYLPFYSSGPGKGNLPPLRSAGEVLVRGDSKIPLFLKGTWIPTVVRE